MFVKGGWKKTRLMLLIWTWYLEHLCLGILPIIQSHTTFVEYKWRGHLVEFYESFLKYIYLMAAKAYFKVVCRVGNETRIAKIKCGGKCQEKEASKCSFWGSWYQWLIKSVALELEYLVFYISFYIDWFYDVGQVIFVFLISKMMIVVMWVGKWIYFLESIQDIHQ